MSNLKSGKLYWVFQVTGWFLTVIIGLFFAQLTRNLDHMPILVIARIVSSYLLYGIIMLIYTHMARTILGIKSWIAKPNHHFLISICSTAISLSLLGTLTHMILYYLLSGFKAFPYPLSYALSVWLTTTFYTFWWLLIYFIIHVQDRNKKIEINKWKWEASMKDAELQVLKAQINPHFIFNALNNIRSLISENPENAKEMVTRFSVMLRAALDFSKIEVISLEQEVDFVQNFLALASLQFEDRLKYDINIEPAALEMKIPPMVLQLLVENSIKHGISMLPEGGFISVHAFKTPQGLQMEVTNSGFLNQKHDAEKRGIGLANISERLRLLFGDSSRIHLEPYGSDAVRATVQIVT